MKTKGNSKKSAAAVPVLAEKAQQISLKDAITTVEGGSFNNGMKVAIERVLHLARMTQRRYEIIGDRDRKAAAEKKAAEAKKAAKKVSPKKA